MNPIQLLDDKYFAKQSLVIFFIRIISTRLIH